MRTEISHFWIGHFKDNFEFACFVGESEDYYNEENDDLDNVYISKFAESQGENWIDHDFMECGFESNTIPFDERFIKYSYAKQWIDIIKERCDSTLIDDVNSVIFITNSQIKNPISLRKEDFYLEYIGEIEYILNNLS